MIYELFFVLLILFFILIFYKNNQTLSIIFFYAFIVRLLVILIDIYFYQIPFSTLDSIGYEWKAAVWGEYGIAYALNNFDIEGKSFYYSNVLSVVYGAIGRSILIAKLFSLTASLLVIFLSYKITILVFKDKTSALVVSIILAAFPLFIIISTFTLREIYILLVFLTSVYFFVHSIQKKFLPSIIFFIISILISLCHIYLHGPFVLIIPVFILIYLLDTCTRVFKSKIYSSILFFGSISLLSAIFVFFIYDSILNIEIPYLGKITDKIDVDLLAFIQQHIRNTDYGNTSYPNWFYPNSYFDIYWLSIVRFFYFLCGPFFAINFMNLVSFFDGIFYLIFVFFIIYNWKKVLKNKLTLYLLLMIIPLIILHSWGVNNSGTGMRHRIKFLPILIIIISPYILNFYYQYIQKK